MMLLQSGRCFVCGCTDGRACRGGCGWADVWATLCSRCARNMAVLILACRKQGIAL